MSGYGERVQGLDMVDFGGLDTRHSELALPDNSSPDMANVDLVFGGISKRDGADLIEALGYTVSHVAPLFIQETGVGFLYFFCRKAGEDAKVFRAPMPGTFILTEIPPPAGEDYPSDPDVTTARAKYDNAPALYLPRRNGIPIVFTGAAAASDAVLMRKGEYGTPEIEDPPTPAVLGTTGYPEDWDDDPPCIMRLVGLGNGSRLCAGGFATDPSRWDYSEMDVPHNFLRQNVDDPGQYNAALDGSDSYANDGDDDVIVDFFDMYSYRVIAKKRSLVLYSGDPGADDYDQVATFNVGCVGPHAWAKVSNDVFFWSEDGPRRMSAVQEYGDLVHSNIAEKKIKGDVMSVPPSLFNKICCIHDTVRSRVIWYVPSSGSAENSVGYAYYYAEDRFAKITGPSGSLTACALVRTDTAFAGRCVGAESGGNIVWMFTSNSDSEGEAIDAYYITKWMAVNNDIGWGASGQYIDVIFNDDGRGDCRIYAETDMSGEFIELTRGTKLHGGGGGVWGSGEWADGGIWGESSRAYVRFEFTALFNLLRLKFASNSTAKWGVMGFKVDARSKGARA